MPSSYTTRNRLTKQAAGEGNNVWGTILNTGVFDLTDFALDGWTTKAITGNITLSSSNGSTDEARARCLKFTGSTAATITIPSVEKVYFVWNASSADQVITTGAGTTASIGSGEVTFVVCDGTNVEQMGDGTQSWKDYVDAQAFAALSGNLPGQTGNANKALTTDGTTARWDDLPQSTITNLTSDLATLTATDTANLAEAKAFAIAMAVTFGV